MKSSGKTQTSISNDALKFVRILPDETFVPTDAATFSRSCAFVTTRQPINVQAPRGSDQSSPRIGTPSFAYSDITKGAAQENPRLLRESQQWFLFDSVAYFRSTRRQTDPFGRTPHSGRCQNPLVPRILGPLLGICDRLVFSSSLSRRWEGAAGHETAGGAGVKMAMSHGTKRKVCYYYDGEYCGLRITPKSWWTAWQVTKKENEPASRPRRSATFPCCRG